MEIKKEKDRNVFFTVSQYSEKDTIKGAGFRWNPTLRRWETTDYKVVEKLIGLLGPNDLVSPIVLNAIQERKDSIKETIQKSMSVTADIDIPAPSGLVYMPFQKAGIDFISHQKNVLVADEMGLGKTIQAIGYINLTPSIKNVLVICPASLKINWKQELEKWLVRPYQIGILNGHGITDITITNYESVKKYFSLLTSQTWDLLVLDESHYIKNKKAQRTKYITGFYDKKGEEKTWIKGLKDYAKQKILLTGTPILNKPGELFTQLKVVGSDLGKNWKKFIQSYVQTDYWGNAIGVKNLEDLQRKLRSSCMIRREKKDVLKELPDKLRQVITLPSDILTETEREKNEEIIHFLSENWDIATGKLKSKTFPFEEISEIRHQQALKKIPYVIEHLENVLENEDKVVVFAHHHDVIDAIYEKFKDISVVATGNESLNQRDEAVKKFQSDPNVKLFIGSTQAMGVGVTLTASSTVIFAEVEWRPGDLFQAEDRLHRIGQKSTVLVQYLLINESIDSFMIKKILSKIDTIEAVTNASKVGYTTSESNNNDVKGVFQVTESITDSKSDQTDKEETIAFGMGEETKEENQDPVLKALKILAGNDPDYAGERNGIGFNGTDTNFGHSLASQNHLSDRQRDVAKRMLIKYHRQLPDDLWQKIFAENDLIRGVANE